MAQRFPYLPIQNLNASTLKNKTMTGILPDKSQRELFHPDGEHASPLFEDNAGEHD
jgi:hypothetical protein